MKRIESVRRYVNVWKQHHHEVDPRKPWSVVRVLCANCYEISKREGQ